jgi:hypothetical protein
MDDMTTSRLRGRAAFWALAGLALFVAHDATYVLQVGPGEPLAAVLRTAGHAYWSWASTALAISALAAGLVALLRVRRLRAHADRVAARPVSVSMRTRLPLTWARLLAVVALAFVAQENVEHVLVHGHLLGPSALLGPENPLALPVLAIITLVGAVVAVLVAGTEAALVAAITAALRQSRRAPRIVPRPPSHLHVALLSVLGTSGAGRAPPRSSLLIQVT